MRKYLYVIILSLLIVSQALGANFYWKSSLAELNAITGVTNADKGVVMDGTNTTFYDRSTGSWAVTGVVANGPWTDVRAYGQVVSPSLLRLM